jgi:hypothetical protein
MGLVVRRGLVETIASASARTCVCSYEEAERLKGIVR